MSQANRNELKRISCDFTIVGISSSADSEEITFVDNDAKLLSEKNRNSDLCVPKQSDVIVNLCSRMSYKAIGLLLPSESHL